MHNKTNRITHPANRTNNPIGISKLKNKKKNQTKKKKGKITRQAVNEYIMEYKENQAQGVHNKWKYISSVRERHCKESTIDYWKSKSKSKLINWVVASNNICVLMNCMIFLVMQTMIDRSIARNGFPDSEQKFAPSLHWEQRKVHKILYNFRYSTHLISLQNYFLLLISYNLY